MGRDPSRGIRALVLARDGSRCQRCARRVGRLGAAWVPYSLQHRHARGMGGTTVGWVNLPANLVTMCGDATTPHGCHAWAESRPPEAYEEGWVLPLIGLGSLPWEVPVRTFHGWLLLDNEGEATYCAEPDPWLTKHREDVPPF